MRLTLYLLDGFVEDGNDQVEEEQISEDYVYREADHYDRVGPLVRTAHLRASTARAKWTTDARGSTSIYRSYTSIQ